MIQSNLLKVSDVKLNRYLDVNANQEYSLLIFRDATQKCYAAAAYLYNSKTKKANLVFAEARVKPTNKISLPRLELMAALIAVRILKFVERELRQNITKRIIFSDSQCVLHWIKSEKWLSVFVATRVREIKLVTNLDFRYVRSKDNPADLPSRGKPLAELPLRRWEGPSWLKFAEKDWPTQALPELSDEFITSYKAEIRPGVMYEVALITIPDPTSPFEIDDTKLSSLNRLIRVTALCKSLFINYKTGTRLTF